MASTLTLCLRTVQGVLYVESCTVTITGPVLFEENEAWDDGGVIFAKSCTVTVRGGVVVRGNIGDKAGFLSVHQPLSLSSTPHTPHQNKALRECCDGWHAAAPRPRVPLVLRGRSSGEALLPKEVWG
jgi:predicted outer membrane repeat protein